MNAKIICVLEIYYHIVLLINLDVLLKYKYPPIQKHSTGVFPFATKYNFVGVKALTACVVILIFLLFFLVL